MSNASIPHRVDGCKQTSLGSQITETGGARRLHSLDLTNLSADTTYYYDIYAGGVTDNNSSNHHSFHTTKVGNGSPHTLFGRVLAQDNTSSAQGVLVYITVTDSNDLVSQQLSSLTNTNGYWFLDLGNLKDITAANHVFSYSVGNTINISVEGGASNGIGSTTKPVGTSPQNTGTITLQVDITQTAALKPGLNLITLPLNPTNTQTSYGLLSSITSAKEIFSWAGSSWGSSAFDVSGTASGTDFNLVPGTGYMLHVGVASNWSVTGAPLSTATDIILVSGLNLVGVSFPIGLTAKGVLPVITGGQVVTQWDAVSQSWKSVFDIGDGTILGQDFNLNGSQDYFIQVDQNSTWTPAVSVTAPQARIVEQRVLTPLEVVNQIQHQIVTNLTSTSATIAFRTDGVGRSQLRWKFRASEPWQTIDNYQSTTSRIHKFRCYHFSQNKPILFKLKLLADKELSNIVQ